jgi:hypothetical protein
MKSTNRILKYLSHIKKLIIEFNADQFLQNENENNIFLISSDAFFADDILIRYSSQEYAFKLFNDMIDWKTFKQRTIITSFIEIELLIISSADKKLIWWDRLFDVIHFRINQRTRIQCDNMQIIQTLITNKLIIKLRHVDIHKHWLRQKITNDQIIIEWVSFTKILTDELTKALSSQRHEKFLSLLELIKSKRNNQDNEDNQNNQRNNEKKEGQVQINRVSDQNDMIKKNDKDTKDHLYQENVSNHLTTSLDQ